MTTNYTLFYQQGEPELHITGCSHSRRRAFVSLTNAIENFDAANWDEALTLSAIDYAEAVDAFAGDDYLVNDDEGGWVLPADIDVHAEVVKEYRKSIKVFPCAKVVSK